MKRTLTESPTPEAPPQEEKPTFRNYPFRHDHSELSSVYQFESKSLSRHKDKINFVVTHGGCSDGFMAATIARMWLKGQGVDLDQVTFLNAFHTEDFTRLPELMKDKYVVVCDFSFPKAIFELMVEATKGNILVLDHHKTAQENLQDISAEYITFDMNHSGAFLAWTYFFGFDNVPKAVLYVEDNDLWLKALPQTREFTATLFSQKFEYDEYEKFFSDTHLIESVFPTGSGMVMQNDNTISKLSKRCVVQFMEIQGRLYFVACLNSSGILNSELGNQVLVGLKNANFSMIYSQDAYFGSTSISYRSMDNRSDTTLIAKISGGGGHRNASGAGIPFKVDHPPGRVIDTSRAYDMLENIYTVTGHGKTFLVLNTACTGKLLVKYLMQERFIGKEGVSRNAPRTEKNLPGYQEGLFCMRNRTQDEKLDEVYSGATTWSYDGFTKCFHVLGQFLPGVLNVAALVEASSQTVDSQTRIDFVDLKNELYKITLPSCLLMGDINLFFDKFITTT